MSISHGLLVLVTAVAGNSALQAAAPAALSAEPSARRSGTVRLGLDQALGLTPLAVVCEVRDGRVAEAVALAPQRAGGWYEVDAAALVIEGDRLCGDCRAVLTADAQLPRKGRGSFVQGGEKLGAADIAVDLRFDGARGAGTYRLRWTPDGKQSGAFRLPPEVEGSGYALWLPPLADSELQDGVRTAGKYDKTPPVPYAKAAEKVLAELSAVPAPLNAAADALKAKTVSDAQWKDVYLAACARRRLERMRPYLDRMRQVIFLKREPDSRKPYDARRFSKGICLLTMDDSAACRVEPLTDHEARDPDVSFDGARVLFAGPKGIGELDLLSAV